MTKLGYDERFSLLSLQHRSYLRGKRFTELKKQFNGAVKPAADEIAKQDGVSEGIVRNDGQLYECINRIGRIHGQDYKLRMLDGKLGNSTTIQHLARLPVEEQRKLLDSGPAAMNASYQQHKLNRKLDYSKHKIAPRSGIATTRKLSPLHFRTAIAAITQLESDLERLGVSRITGQHTDAIRDIIKNHEHTSTKQ